MASKRKRITLETKAAIIEAVERKTKTNAQICRDFDLPSSTLYTILKDKGKIMNAHDSGHFDKDRKKLRLADFDDVDKALVVWFNQARSKQVPLSGPILLEKATEIAERMGHSNFSGSTGWLDRFKLRHGIVFKNVCGESASVCTTSTDSWKETHMQRILKDYDPKDIFNADETGLFYRCLPSRTLATKGETCSGDKIPKDRITLMVAANMNGTEKLPLLTIGRFEKPRCMKNVKSLPAVWKANRKAWMTSQIFEEWLKKLDRKMLMQGRSIAMIVDNCPAHPSIQGLRAVELIFLPPNTTSVLQLCDQGIIQALKTRYRKRVLKRLIASIETHDDNKAHLKLTVLDAITMAATAWDEVTPTTIANCFRHAGFVLNDVNVTATTTTHTETINKDPERFEMEQLFTEVTNRIPVEQTIDDYLAIDSDVPYTREDMSTEQIVAAVQETVEVEPTEDDTEDPTLPPVSAKSA